MKPSEELPCTVERDVPFLATALEIAGSFAGARLRRDGGPGVHFGRNPPAGTRLLVPSVESYRREDVPVDVLDGELLPGSSPPTLPFDLVAAMRFWIADEDASRLAGSAWDEHGRLRAEHSAAADLHLLGTPIVNRYLLRFRRELGSAFGRPMPGHLPPGKRCRILLTHDVDDPVDPADPRHEIRRVASALRHGRLPVAALRSAALLHRLPRALLPGRARAWHFPGIMHAEESRGFCSTFFFAARCRDERTAHRLDVPYHLASPGFRRVLAALRRRGFEVALHASYRGAERVEAIREEIHRLTRALGGPIRGTRSHYWRIGRPPWEGLTRLATAGLAYDSSLAFNDRIGYRMGVAFPYRPFDPASGMVIPILEIPVLGMDAAYHSGPHRPAESVVDEFAENLRILKLHEGVAALDWHVRSSFPGPGRYREWGRSYLAILDRLASDSEVEVVRCEDLLDQ